MSTDPGALRRRESYRPEAGIASLVVPDANAELDEIKSKVHYIWFPFVDISLVGPDGLRFRLGKGWSYYGMGLSGDDFGSPISIRTEKTPAIPRPASSRAAETREEYEARYADRLLRCTAYPLWNIWYKDSKYNIGDFTPEENIRGNDLGSETPQRDRQQLAGVCAADFLSRYREDYGARVLVPFIGMDGNEQKTVAELFELVQPYAYPLTNLREEVETGELRDEETLLFDLADRGPAHERIIAARLDDVLAKKAHELRRILRGGVIAATNTARRDWAELMEQLGNTAKGQKGFKKGPSPYDREIAWLLKQPVPAALVMPQDDGELRSGLQQVTSAVDKLAGVVAQQQTAPQPGFDLDEARTLLAEIRAEKRELEALRQSHTPETPATGTTPTGKKETGKK